MKSRFLICLALILIVSLIGCATKKPLVIEPHGDTPVNLPVRFHTYHDLYTFIAQREGLPNAANSLFKLAADSETKIYAFDAPPPYLWVITPHFYNGGIFDEIRGAQGNGSYYVLCPPATNFTSLDTDRGFKLVGVAAGNSLRWSSLNHNPPLITTWHMGGGPPAETVYEWNGKFFEQMK